MLFPFYLAFFPAIVTSRQTSDQMNEFQGRHGTIWERLLWTASNGTGKLSRDPFMEAAVQRLFTESLIPKIAAGEEILCTKLEPVWLFPIGPIEVKKKSFRGELTACNIHMHNLKTAKITDIIIQRNEELSTKAVKAIFHIPIMWMTGKYKMERGLFLGFIPARSSGHFNIDLKHVTVGVLASLKTENATSVVLDQFEIGIHWRGTTIKFDSQRRKWDQISDFLINKLNIGHVIVTQKRVKIINEIEEYARGLFECILYEFYKGPKECMINWWVARGFTYPWEYPVCD